MNWLPFFRDPAPLRAEIARLEAALQEAEDAYVAMSQRVASAEAASAAMERLRNPETATPEIKEAVARIADVYASGHRTVARRDAAVFEIILRLLCNACSGTPAWNAAALARAAYEDIA